MKSLELGWTFMCVFTDIVTMSLVMVNLDHEFTSLKNASEITKYIISAFICTLVVLVYLWVPFQKELNKQEEVPEMVECHSTEV